MASYLRGTALAAEQVAQVAYQAGWRGDDLAHIVGLSTQREAGNESTGYRAYAGAHRTDTNVYGKASGDFGLTQINWGTWGQQLIEAGIIRTHTDLWDPLTNLRAAKFVHERQGWSAWGAGSGGWKQGGDAWYGVNRAMAEAAVQRASSQGLIGTDYQQTAGASSTTQQAAGSLPRDAFLVRTENGLVATFKIADGVGIYYGNVSAAQAAGRPVASMSSQQLWQRFGSLVEGGDASELAEIPTAFGTYNQYVNTILDQLFTVGDPRRRDPEIMRVLATRVGRPDMTEAEYENLLKSTRYYQTRTEGQLRWNDLSEAERQVQRGDMETRMRQSFQSLIGRAPNAEELASGWWRQTVDELASGSRSYGTWVEESVKKWAETAPESPWSRQLRDEQEAQRQRPIEIENTMLRLRQTLDRWGWSTDDRSLRHWATSLANGTMSDDDINTVMDQQATILYGSKPKGMETIVWAAPWIETYNRVLERQGSLKTPEIAKTLAAYARDPDNNDPWSFEQRLKMTADYDQTKQGTDDAWSTVSELAGMMGF